MRFSIAAPRSCAADIDRLYLAVIEAAEALSCRVSRAFGWSNLSSDSRSFSILCLFVWIGYFLHIREFLSMDRFSITNSFVPAVFDFDLRSIVLPMDCGEGLHESLGVADVRRRSRAATFQVTLTMFEMRSGLDSGVFSISIKVSSTSPLLMRKLRGVKITPRHRPNLAVGIAVGPELKRKGPVFPSEPR